MAPTIGTIFHFLFFFSRFVFLCERRLPACLPDCVQACAEYPMVRPSSWTHKDGVMRVGRSPFPKRSLVLRVSRCGQHVGTTMSNTAVPCGCGLYICSLRRRWRRVALMPLTPFISTLPRETPGAKPHAIVPLCPALRGVSNRMRFTAPVRHKTASISSPQQAP